LPKTRKTGTLSKVLLSGVSGRCARSSKKASDVCCSVREFGKKFKKQFLVIYVKSRVRRTEIEKVFLTVSIL
jgi:hypothetical protein